MRAGLVGGARTRAKGCNLAHQPPGTANFLCVRVSYTQGST